MPVGVTAEAVGHRPAALADEHHRLLGGDHAGAGRGGDLADAVAGDGADPAERVGRVRERATRAASRLDATSSGWATAVSRIVSASASVP